MLIAIVFGIGTICNTQNILFGKITTIENSATTRFDGVSSNLELTGASYTDTTIKKMGIHNIWNSNNNMCSNSN